MTEIQGTTTDYFVHAVCVCVCGIESMCVCLRGCVYVCMQLVVSGYERLLVGDA